MRKEEERGEKRREEKRASISKYIFISIYL
jgi:hypothetical protein